MITEKDLRPVWAEIDLDKIKHNVGEVKKIVKNGTIICAVVKADAYGHGVIEIGDTLLKNGVDRFAVSTLEEAIQLRNNGYTRTPIIILGHTPEGHGEAVVDNNIIQTIYTYNQALYFSNLAKERHKEATIHLKLDTGMSRLGFLLNPQSLNDIKKIFELPNLVVEGIFTHLATAGEINKDYTYKQFYMFMDFVDRLEKEGYSIPIKHISNSAAVIDLPEMNLDMVRTGIILYGLYPSDHVNREKVKLKQAMELKARVSHVKVLSKGLGISYGSKYTTSDNEKIITIPIGYADGYTRALSGKAKVIVGGHKIPIVGDICMDQCMANATNLDIKTGDEVILYSSNSESGITIDDIADKIGTINYEVICMLGKRVPRVYLENNNLLHIKDNLLI
ncbi:MAG: alanine racemase [Candidatus Alkaliphilus sp. MAG34]|nr:alanine racemase [Clostridiales bacterium]